MKDGMTMEELRAGLESDAIKRNDVQAKTIRDLIAENKELKEFNGWATDQTNELMQCYVNLMGHPIVKFLINVRVIKLEKIESKEDVNGETS